jgi:hypothetical protein
MLKNLVIVLGLVAGLSACMGPYGYDGYDNGYNGLAYYGYGYNGPAYYGYGYNARLLWIPLQPARHGAMMGIRLYGCELYRKGASGARCLLTVAPTKRVPMAQVLSFLHTI